MGTARMGLVAVGVGLMAIVPVPEALRAQEGPRSSASRASAVLPRPPRQDEAWTPPKSGLPAPVVEAARLLFQQGFADPRGCAYRAAELAGEAEAHRGLIKRPAATHAWVLPFEATGGPRYAVAWNGLVYPVTRLGPAADLDADIRALVKRFEGGGMGGMRSILSGVFTRDPMHQRRASDNIQSASESDLAAAKVVLLLRLGRADLAELVWKVGPGWQAAMDNKIDVYANLAVDWEWALLDRAGAAHAVGDDPLALASLRELARIKPLIEGRPGVLVPPPVPGFVDFLAQLPRFLADQERRAREPARAPAVRSTFPDRAARIVALIRDLDQSSWTMQGPPSFSDPAGREAFEAIVKEGEAAVGPLLDGLERDDRLTRAVVRDHRHNSRWLHVQGVDEAAYEALTRILGTRELGPQARYYSGRSDRMMRKAVAAEIQAYWEKTRGLGRLERLYRTLADDEATRDQWIDAAESLVQRVIHRPGFECVPPRHLSGGVAPRGEPLRGRKDPGVTELMARRAHQLDTLEGPFGPNYGIRQANRMARALAAWDLKGALPTLKERVLRSEAGLRQGPANDTTLYGLDVEIAQFTRLRVRGGDAAALDEYAAWVRTTPRPNVFGYFQPEMFEPLWAYPDHPSIAAAAVALFENPSSPWVPLYGPDDRGWGERGSHSDVIISPMLGVAPFRKQVLAGLADDRPSGSVECDAGGKVTVVVDKSLSQLPTFRDDDPLRPRPGTSTPLRMRDKYAWKLQEVAGFPRFEMHWPREMRDRAIAQALERLSRFGERFRTTEVSHALYEQASFYPRFMQSILVFRPLDRPATAEDAAAGRAIFASPGAEARRWPMPSVPMEGRWMELEIPRDDPYLRQFDHVSAKYSSGLDSPQRGLVWQAEEVREGGRWRRYYGFVGRHEIARVPAEELDFPSPWNTGWSDLSREFEARLVPPGGRDDGRLILIDPVRVGGPLPIVMTIRNRRGIAVAVPTDLARQGRGAGLRDGVSIRILRQPEPKKPDRVAGGTQQGAQQPGSTRSQPAANYSQQTGLPEAPWPEVVPRREPERYRSEAARTLEPTETAEVLRFDIRDLFDLDQPGRYEVHVELAGIRTLDGKPARVSAPFELKPADSGDTPR